MVFRHSEMELRAQYTQYNSHKLTIPFVSVTFQCLMQKFENQEEEEVEELTELDETDEWEEWMGFEGGIPSSVYTSFQRKYQRVLVTPKQRQSQINQDFD